MRPAVRAHLFRRAVSTAPLFLAASLLVVPSSYALSPAAHPSLIWLVPPYTLGTKFVNISTANSGCGGTYSQAIRPTFNLALGRVHYGEYVNVSSGCSKASTAVFIMKVGMSISPFKVKTSGWYTIRSHWIDSVEFNLTYNYYPASPKAWTEVILGDGLDISDLSSGHSWKDSTNVTSFKTSYGCYFCILAGYLGVPTVGRIKLSASDTYNVTTYAWIQIGVALPGNSGRSYVQSAEAWYYPHARGAHDTELSSITIR